jgi:hypothetical protein
MATDPARHSHQPRRPGSEEAGVALIFALFFAVITLGITIAGSIYIRAHSTQTEIRFATAGQAAEFANSGLVEALGWFRRQTAQPVTAFDPVLNELADPPVLDTLEPEVGIVREFEISGSLWGRYEVWKQWDADPDAELRAFRQQAACRDVSDERGNLSSGSVWRLRSVGYVFRRNDEGRRFDESPNRVIAKEIVETEIRRLALQPPSQAAVCLQRGDRCYVGTRGRIQGGANGAGVVHAVDTGSPTVTGTASSISGAPPSTSIDGYDDSLNAVFGVSLSELKGMADMILTDPASFPQPLPKQALIVAETDIVFDGARPLTGTGIVVVVGNVTIDQASYSSFSGLLYVDGDLTVREPSELQGAIVVTGRTRVEGAADFATITFDDSIVNALRQTLGTYRQASSAIRPLRRDDY